MKSLVSYYWQCQWFANLVDLVAAVVVEIPIPRQVTQVVLLIYFLIILCMCYMRYIGYKLFILGGSETMDDVADGSKLLSIHELNLTNLSWSHPALQVLYSSH